MNTKRIIVIESTITKEKARNVFEEFENMALSSGYYNKITNVMMNCNVPLSILSPRDTIERGPSVVLYNAEGNPIIRIFNVEIFVDDEFIVFTSIIDGSCVMYPIGEKEPEPKGNDDEKCFFCENFDDIPSCGINEEQKNENSDGTQSWKWELVNDIYKKVKK